jgi:hypothetical protein
MPRVRLVRQTSPNGKVPVLATNLDSQAHSCHAFAQLYHQRWRIEEAFKRLKLRMKLESISGLSQQALIIDVAAKVLADNITSLMCSAAAEQSNLCLALAQVQSFLRRHLHAACAATLGAVHR